MSAAPLVFGSPEAQRVARRNRNLLRLEPLYAALEEAKCEAEYWRRERNRILDEIRAIEEGETDG